MENDPNNTVSTDSMAAEDALEKQDISMAGAAIVETNSGQHYDLELLFTLLEISSKLIFLKKSHIYQSNPHHVQSLTG